MTGALVWRTQDLLYRRNLPHYTTTIGSSVNMFHVLSYHLNVAHQSMKLPRSSAVAIALTPEASWARSLKMNFNTWPPKISLGPRPPRTTLWLGWNGSWGRRFNRLAKTAS